MKITYGTQSSKERFCIQIAIFTFAFTPIIYFVTHIYPYLLIWNGYVSVEWSCVSVPVGSDAEGVERRGVEAGGGPRGGHGVRQLGWLCP